jgi:hypothetical protein
VRGMVSRMLTRAILSVIALLFLLGALVFAHIALWFWLRTTMNQTFVGATGILGGGDLLLAAGLGFLASRSVPSRAELEALDVRRKAIQALGGTLSTAQLMIALFRIIANLMRGRRN